jgi:hypothetical protein
MGGPIIVWPPGLCDGYPSCYDWSSGITDCGQLGMIDGWVFGNGVLCMY